MRIDFVVEFDQKTLFQLKIFFFGHGPFFDYCFNWFRYCRIRFIYSDISQGTIQAKNDFDVVAVQNSETV